MSVSNIFLSDPQQSPTVRITQLFDYLELFSEGVPPHNTLFVMGRAPAFPASGVEEQDDQLLIVDPPADVVDRFRLDGRVAVLSTGQPLDVELPRVATVEGGLAHVRVGEHFLDIYSQRCGAVVHLPALGVICSGAFGSDALLPQIVGGSDGGDELDTLRLLARLLKQRPLQLFVPACGAPADDTTHVMERLAADVAYLHGLRRVIPKALERGDALETVEILADSLLPVERSNDQCRLVHENNVRTVLAAAGFHDDE